MAQMKKCPRCGADNSIKRTTCYVCGAALDASEQQAAAPSGSTASQRFAAILEERSRQPQGGAEAKTAASPHPLPTFYASIGQVRRAMHFFRQLHDLVQAGLPVSQALTDLRSRADPQVRNAARAMARHVTAGGRLSDAMPNYPNLFLAYHVALVHAGELAGSLPQTLDQIAADCETEYQVRQGIAVALFPVYLVLPVMLAVMPLALILRGAQPPDGWTPAALGSRYVGTALRVSLPIIVGIGAAWFTWMAGARSPALMLLQHRVLLSLPLVGGAYKRTGMMRFLGSLSLLLRAGVPIAEAYRAAAAATGNAALARELLRELDNLYAGRGLVDTLRKFRLVSDVAMDRLTIGETVGKLPEVLSQISGDYRQYAARSARYLPRLVQLAAYLALAPLVAIIVYSLYSAYWDLRLFRPLDMIDKGP
jgi:MSHA biogenesis protein MshG